MNQERVYIVEDQNGNKIVLTLDEWVEIADKRIKSLCDKVNSHILWVKVITSLILLLTSVTGVMSVAAFCVVWSK